MSARRALSSACPSPRPAFFPDRRPCARFLSALGPYFALSHIRNLNIIGDIGCYTLGAGHPWNALDTCTCMGASLSISTVAGAKGRGESDEKRHIVAVIGDSTFLHMGMAGLLNTSITGATSPCCCWITARSA
ncbi:MAG: thiamine pyrophosphate-dependent enzyme [Candidatus Competibacteraceae bacterium]